MNSKRSLGWVKNLAVVAGASLLFASLASAQEFHGKFTLPFQAQWGKVTLPSGNYTVDVTRSQGGVRLVRVNAEAQGSHRVAILLPMAHNTKMRTDQSELVCIREGSARIVRALELGPLAETLYFALPKGAAIYAQKGSGQKHVSLAELPASVEVVPITATAR